MKTSYSSSISFTNILKWILIIFPAAILIGSASAFFLIALNWVTNYREANLWIITFLPLAGLAIGLAYYYWGNESAKGNNLLLEEYHQPKKNIPFIIAPLVFFGTLITHLFGGSAGREGTAVQMGGAIADQFTNLFNLAQRDRQLLIVIGISAGFASVFGTPLAGAVFALEIVTFRRLRFDAVLPSLFAAFIANYVCRLWSMPHIHYSIPLVPDIDFTNVLWAILAGVAFGLTAWLFAQSSQLFSRMFTFIKYPPLRPFAGGLIITIIVWVMGTTKYIGLGIPTIQEAFLNNVPQYDFMIKLLLTAFTLSAGFKGGEVTPLFFIGATLGNALGFYIPLPFALLAGMGFAAVFSGAANTPLACTIMGIELFGLQSGFYVGIACFAAYVCAGHPGIYTSQAKGTKYVIFGKLKRKRSEVL